MSNTQSKSIPFRVSSRMIRMFGRQNVSNPLVAIIELIKNAYDADANTVDVTFSNVSTSSATIVISDDGSGMDEEALTDRWMMIGTNYKEREPVSPRGRVRTGAKGIGRFALDRLGDIGIVETFQAASQEGLRLVIDWTKYDNLDQSFESINHELSHIPNIAKKSGTKITITNLRDQWTRDEFSSLYDDLVFLIPPLDSYNMNFVINLDIDDYAELSGQVKPLAKEEAEYELSSSISPEGLVRHVLRHRSGKEIIKEFSWSQVDTRTKLFETGPACGSVQAKLLFYLNDPKQVKSFDYKQADLQRYLKTFRGVRIYRDGFQIKPYGSKGNDWLELDARKHASLGGVKGTIGAYRINNRQIIGTVTVSRQTNPALEDRTSREGLIENEAYFDLKKFLMNGLSFIEVERQYYEQRKNGEKKENSLEQTVENIATTIEKIQTAPVIYEDIIDNPIKQDTLQEGNLSAHIDKEEKDTSDIIRSQITLATTIDTTIHTPLQEKKIIVNEKDFDILVKNVNDLETQIQEIQILRSLATIGIALVTFSHEIKSDVFLLSYETNELKNLMSLIPKEGRKETEKSLATVNTAVHNIQDWSNFVLERTKKSRRIESIIDFQELVKGLFQSFETSLRHHLITSDIQISENIPLFKAFPIDYEAIFINFISNASKVLEGKESRHIRCSANYSQNQLKIVFEDNGPGIDSQNLPHPHASIQQIFDPFTSGRTDDGRSNDGTGMGLAIVKRIVNDLGGTVWAEEHGELGGAKFIVKLPIKKVES